MTKLSTVTIACIADTHGAVLEAKKLPKTDLLLIAGDITKRGCHREFLEFAKQLPNWSGNFGQIVYVPGKHDVAIENHQEKYTELLQNASNNFSVLIHDDIRVFGLHIWGTPYSIYNPVWAFTAKNQVRKHLISQIPRDIDILLSYSPPHLIMDEEKNNSGYYYSIGCKYIRKAVEAIKPQLHVFGGSHENQGTKVINKGKTTCINASYISTYDRPYNDIIVTEATSK